MAIGPVDFRPMVTKVNDVARQQIEQQQRIIGHDQQVAETSLKQSDRNTRSVHAQDQANKVAITEKEERNSGRQNSEKEKGKEENKKDAETQKARPVKAEEVHIDIRL
jgi:hypothetical protein